MLPSLEKVLLVLKDLLSWIVSYALKVTAFFWVCLAWVMSFVKSFVKKILTIITGITRFIRSKVYYTYKNFLMLYFTALFFSQLFFSTGENPLCCSYINSFFKHGVENSINTAFYLVCFTFVWVEFKSWRNSRKTSTTVIGSRFRQTIALRSIFYSFCKRFFSFTSKMVNPFKYTSKISMLYYRDWQPLYKKHSLLGYWRANRQKWLTKLNFFFFKK